MLNSTLMYYDMSLASTGQSGRENRERLQRIITTTKETSNIISMHASRSMPPCGNHSERLVPNNKPDSQDTGAKCRNLKLDPHHPHKCQMQSVCLCVCVCSCMCMQVGAHISVYKPSSNQQILGEFLEFTGQPVYQNP